MDRKSFKKWLLPSLLAALSWAASQYFLYDLGFGLSYQVLFCLGYAFVLLAGSRQFGFVFIYRVMLPLTFGLLLVWLYQSAYSVAPVADFLSASRANQEYLRWLFDILSTLYAICRAFLLWKGLTDHDHLRQMLSDEANFIERLVGYVHYFNLNKTKNQTFACGLLGNLRDYIDNINQGDEIRASEENGQILRDCVNLISGVDSSEDDNDKVALAETMKSLSDLAMARSKRISQMEIKMSPYLLMALGVMSLAVVYPFFTEAPSQTDYVREMCILILGSILSFLLITLLDISRPFNGFWKIKTDSFKAVRKLIEAEIVKIENMNIKP